MILRVTYRHHRGEYLQPRNEVKAGVPAIFGDFTKQAVDNRLEFAQWLVSEANPLAARVAVNRAWREFFGRGILSTAGDFGTQSAQPSHPEFVGSSRRAFRRRRMVNQIAASSVGAFRGLRSASDWGSRVGSGESLAFGISRKAVEG